MQPQYPTPREVEHIWNYLTEDEQGCWIWSGGRDNHGYPRAGVHIPGKRPQPFRSVRPIIYELATGQTYTANVDRIFNQCGNKLCARFHPDHNVVRAITARPPYSKRSLTAVEG